MNMHLQLEMQVQIESHGVSKEQFAIKVVTQPCYSVVVELL